MISHDAIAATGPVAVRGAVAGTLRGEPLSVPPNGSYGGITVHEFHGIDSGRVAAGRIRYLDAPRMVVPHEVLRLAPRVRCAVPVPALAPIDLGAAGRQAGPEGGVTPCRPSPPGRHQEDFVTPGRYPA